ncbi:hypothetical protein [Owenweeksia hongkongensis]|uniref:hypothetical protein n=1 Tax=Owenweeksia hongkongensis TaxID=253245 RepID=UPI003A8FB4C9
MKIYLFESILMSIFLLAVTLLSSCEKKPKTEIPSDGRATFKINGIEMVTELRAGVRDSKFGFAAEKYRMVEGSLSPWETLTISELQKKTDSVQRIFNRDTIASTYPDRARHVGGYFGTPQADGDVTCDIFNVIEQDSVNNWVRINKQQDDFKKVWGSFSLHLYRTESCSSTMYPDTLLITDGQFYFSL